MKIQVSRVMKAKSSYTSQRETVVTSSFGACSLAMDDGGRCLLDVIGDPKLLQSFLESGSDENSKDPQDGTSSESAVESPQVARTSHSGHTNHISSNESIIENPDQMGYSYAVDGQGLLAQSGVCSSGASLGGMSLVVASSPVNPQTYQHASSSGATIHHLPSSVTHANLHPHSPASARSATPISHNIKSPGQGPPSIHSMPPPSPLQQTRSPLPSHTPSPAPAWSPAPPVLSPATSRTPQSSMPSVAFQQSHNPIIQTTCSVTQFVTALAASQQSITQKLTLQQQQQQLFLQQQLPQAPQQQQSASRLTAVHSAVATSSTITVPQQQMVQLIHAPSNVTLPTRTSHSSVRPIQPKLPPQILPKPATSASSQFVSQAPTPKQAPPTPVTTNQRTVGVGIQQAAPSQLVIGQGQPGMFSGPGGTFLVNQIIPGVGQNPILIQSNIPGILTMRGPPGGAAPGQSLNSNTTQNNATLIAALQGPSQHAQTLFAQAKSAIHGQQTIVIPNNISNAGMASQNINLTPAALPNSGLISSSQGQGLFARSNIILSPRVVGGNPGLQLQQIPTPTGSIITFANGQAIAVPHLQAGLGGAHLAPVTGPMHNIMTGQGVISGLSLQSHTPPTALHQQQQQSLFGTVPFTSHLEHSPHVIQVPQPLTPQQAPVNHPGHLQPQPVELSPTPASPPKPAKIPSVNLEELLKEHGIVPESPLPSPDCNSPVMEEPVPSQQPQQQQQQQSLVPSQQQLLTALQSQQVVLEQPQGHAGVPHLKLAFTQDGSVILQQHPLSNNPGRVQHYLSSNQIIGRTANSVGSVILPTVSTPAVSVPVVTTDTTPSHNHSTLIARLNAGPAISVPDVSSLALSSSVCISTPTTTSITTTITTTATALVPLTVQSLSMNSCPVSNSYVVQRTNILPGTLERVFISEDVRTSQSHATPVISSSSTMQTVQSKSNANSAAFQALLIPSEHGNRTITHHMAKTVQSVNPSSTVSQSVQQLKCTEKDEQLVEIVDSSNVQNHNHATFLANVPNSVSSLLSRVRKEIADIMAVKNHNTEQQKTLQLLMSAQQKLLLAAQNKFGRGVRGNQNQYQAKMEIDVERLLQKCRANQCVVSEPQQQQQQQQQQQTKVPVLTVQQSGQLEKQQNIKTANSHNLHLVNLLKQNSQHTASAKHLAPPTTTITTVCDSTTTPTTPVTAIQKVSQVINAAPPRLQTAHQQCSNKASEVVPQQVIVRVQKPTQQQQPVQTVPNLVQIKGAAPVKKVVNTVPKPVLFNERLTKDQNAAVKPDVHTPFTSKRDACHRLLAYHVYNAKTPSKNEIYRADVAFNDISIQLQNNLGDLFNRFQLSQLKESMRPAPVPEQIMLDRFFIEDEQEALKADKASVAEGKSLSLPPLPNHWLEEQRAAAALKRATPSPPVVVKEEKDSFPDEQDSYSREFSDQHTADDSDPPYKEDDNLEAPVIDSCEDIVVPPHDENCERSPPTLKRIVIKPSKRSGDDSEETAAPSRKRFKFNSSSSTYKQEPSCGWEDDRPVVPKHSDNNKDSEPARANHGCYREYFSDKRITDIVSELHKEFVMSPMEMNDNGSSHGVDLEVVQPNHLADFEPPVPRTEEPSCSSSALYDGGFRNNCSDFDLLSCSDWTSEYVPRRAPNESDAAAVTNHTNPSELDLSSLDGLGDHLDDSQSCIPNGIGEEEDMNCIGFRIPKDNKRFEGESSQAPDQVQSAIKSITGTPTENHSYYDSTNYLLHQGSGYEEESRNQRGEPDLEEAVRSILM